MCFGTFYHYLQFLPPPLTSTLTNQIHHQCSFGVQGRNPILDLECSHMLSRCNEDTALNILNRFFYTHTLLHSLYKSCGEKINLASLPATSDAARQHCLQVYHQVAMWCGLDKDSEQYGKKAGTDLKLIELHWKQTPTLL